MRAHEKKKLWKLFIKMMVKQGQVPNDRGTWVKADMGLTSHRHMIYGHKAD